MTKIAHNPLRAYPGQPRKTADERAHERAVAARPKTPAHGFKLAVRDATNPTLNMLISWEGRNPSKLPMQRAD